MKRKNRLFWSVPLVLVCLSCSDDDDIGKAGDISFYGETYSLEQGAIYHDNNHAVIAVEDYVFEDSYVVEGKTQTDKVEGFTAEIKNGQTGNFLIGLYEPGFVLSDLTNDARGNGACICLRLASPETERLVPGKYIFSLNHDEFTFMGYSSADYYSGSDVTPNELAEGEVNVAQEGEVYTIDFNCKTTFGGEIKGTYTGKLKAFDVRKNVEAVYDYADIKLEALLESVDYTDLEGVAQSEPDYLRANSFYASATQQIYSANLYRNLAESAKEDIDIALAYDEEKEAVYFESPIKMRALLWHDTYENETLFDYTFNLPCHTKYMPAPEDFTNEDFEALAEQGDFNFDFTEARAEIPVNAALPCFVFVQTGNGQKGVIRVKSISPESTEMIAGVVYPANPSVVMDIKFPRTYSEQQIR